MSFHLCLSLPFLALICYRFLGPIFSFLQYIALWCPILSDRISFYHMNGISSKSLHNWIVSQSGDGGGNALQANIHIFLGVSWPLHTFPTFHSQERRPKIHMDLGTLQSHGLSDGCDASDGAGGRSCHWILWPTGRPFWSLALGEFHGWKHAKSVI